MSVKESEEFLNKFPTLPQRQDSVDDQLCDLVIIAIKAGMYDAADLIQNILKDENIN